MAAANCSAFVAFGSYLTCTSAAAKLHTAAATPGCLLSTFSARSAQLAQCRPSMGKRLVIIVFIFILYTAKLRAQLLLCLMFSAEYF